MMQEREREREREKEEEVRAEFWKTCWIFLLKKRKGKKDSIIEV